MYHQISIAKSNNTKKEIYQINLCYEYIQVESHVLKIGGTGFKSLQSKIVSVRLFVEQEGQDHRYTNLILISLLITFILYLNILSFVSVKLLVISGK